MNNDNTLYSWPIIILCLIIFWPVGVYLIYKKTQTEKTASLTGANLLKILGIILIVIGVCTIVAFVGIFYLIAGIVLLVFSKKLRTAAEDTKRYLAIVVNGNVRSLDSISATIGRPYDVVRQDLQKLINDGYFKNAYIDESARQIVLAQPAPVNNYAYSGGAVPGAVNTAPRVVACPCCGANNTISGATGECEYCGSPLS